jgi:DNA-binding NtrC family response regulator
MMRSIKKSILIGTKSSTAGQSFQDCLEEKYVLDIADDVAKFQDFFQLKKYEHVFVDINFLVATNDPNMIQADLEKELSRLWQVNPMVAVIIMVTPERIRDTVYALKSGAGSFIIYPIDPDEVRYALESVHNEQRKQSELDYLRGKFWQKDSLNIIQSKCSDMKKVYDKIRSAAPTRTTVMLYGETGTGKSILARLIHRHSNRRNNPFISVHCGAMPDTLLESELFGHEKGSFTGAVRRKLGKFEIAQGGTIFLDEIATITPAAQIKLLQVLQERTYQRVGGEELIEANVRILGASNMDLKDMCRAGTFRNDLYYRLNVFPVEIPRLKDRKDDIPNFVEFFIAQLNKYYSKDIREIHPDVLEAFKRYSWPGNIRELENLIERAYILETGNVLTPPCFPAELFDQQVDSVAFQFDFSRTLAEVRTQAVENAEKKYLIDLMETHKGIINESSKHAGISTRQLHKLLTKYNIRKEKFK